MIRQNGISVEEMLELEILGDSELLSGAKGIRNTVSKVNIMADPDILDWVGQGEFLLTTAYYFEKDNIQMQKKLIKECSKKGLAGLGIKVVPYLDSLSEELLDYADELNFPLIDIHYSVPLSDIMMEVIKLIFNKQASLLERIEKLHEQLMVAMLEGEGVEDIVKIIFNNIKNPVVLSIDFSSQLYQRFGNLNEDSKKALIEDVQAFYRPNNNKSKVKKLDEGKVLIGDKFIYRMIMPIVLKDKVYGHIFAWAVSTPLGGFDLSILESASTTIALAVLQNLSVKEVEIRHRSDFFEDLISTDSKRKRKALDRAHFYNLHDKHYYLIEVMSFKFKLDSHGNDDFLFEYLRDYTNNTVSIIEEVMEYLNLNGIVSTKLNGIQILLGFENLDNINDRLDKFNNEILNIFENKFKNMEVKIGIGRAYKGLENVNKSFYDAVKTIRTGRMISDKKIISFDELGIFKILCQDVLVEELEDFYNSTLKSLVDYDKKKSTELVKTLEAYFVHKGNLTRMSEALFTHYNTILYRINRINEITGMNLNDSSDSLNLEIALKIREIMDK